MSAIDGAPPYSVQNEANRYRDIHKILRSEDVYGSGFQSPGGISGFNEVLGGFMELRPGMTILDIGSGLGGAAIHLARHFDVHVIGIDTAPLMCEIARSRNSEIASNQRVTFINGTIFDLEKMCIDFDLIYSRDALMYDSAKNLTFLECYKLLKKSGRIVISDFCGSLGDEHFAQYVNTCGYHLLTIKEYAETLSSAGFKIERQDDISSIAKQQLESDLTRYLSNEFEGRSDTTDEDSKHLSKRWRLKIDYLDRGWLTQGRFIAAKT